MFSQELSERKKRILQAVVEAHIAYGEPVGSKYLARDEMLSCSPATIRNEMAELEEMGYLEQPHTSAGRVPSEAGYRFYVNSLLERYSATQSEIHEIGHALNRKLGELDQILAEASRLASSITNYPSIAAKPRAAGVTVDRFDKMFIDSHTFALMMLLQGGAVKTKHVRSGFPLTPQELDYLIYQINLHLAGKTADQITMQTVVDLERAMGAAAPIVNPLVKLIFETMQECDAGDLRVEGVNRLIGIPDYSDMDEIKSLIHLFEQKDDLLEVISTQDTDRDIHVRIGRETAVDGMGNSSLVYRTIRADGKVLGVIGVIGPRRMDYGKVISIIDNLALGIDNLLSGGVGYEEE
jgi:heat-inducible transcriptional repressor